MEAHAMIAKDGEDVPFEDPFAMAGAVEVWLNELVTFMRDTLRLSLDASLQDASMWDTERPREEWVASYPAQIALITSQIVAFAARGLGGPPRRRGCCGDRLVVETV